MFVHDLLLTTRLLARPSNHIIVQIRTQAVRSRYAVQSSFLPGCFVNECNFLTTNTSIPIHITNKCVREIFTNVNVIITKRNKKNYKEEEKAF